MKNPKRHLVIILLALLLPALNFAQKDGSKSLTKFYNVKGSGTLKINLFNGDININTSRNHVINVVLSSNDDVALEKIEVEQSDNNITITSNPDLPRFDKVSLNIEIPQDYNIDASTNSGDVRLKGILIGSFSVYTAGGDVTTESIKGYIKISANGGNIITGDVDGDLDVNTNGGNITVGDISGKANIRTMGGSIKAGNIGNDSQIYTYGGNIKAGIINGRGNIQTMGGDINIKKITGNSSLITYGGSIFLAAGKGQITAQTQGGDITLSNISGSVFSSTAAGNISVELLNVTSPYGSIKTTSGSIKLYVSQNIKATINATVKGQNWKNNDENKPIKSDFPAQKYNFSKIGFSTDATYQLNGGGGTINLLAVNGMIEIRKK